MTEDLFGRSIKEQIQAELREHETPYEFEYMNALAYFGLSAYATEEEARRVYRRKVAQYHTDTGNTSNEIGKINSNHDIIKKYFKHIKWKNSVRNKKVEIQTLMKNDITFSNIDSSLTALSLKLNSIYNTYFRKVEDESTIVGLNYLYNQYRNTLREEYKNVLMVYGNIELDPSINTLQEFNNFLINLLNKNKLAFLEELDNEYNKYQNDESYRPLLKIIINLINESKAQVQGISFLNEKTKQDISTNLRTKINKLKENYDEIKGTLKYLQEFFAEIKNEELSAKSKLLLERLSNLQNEEELNQINNEVEPLENKAKEYEKKKEQEEIDNYIKELIAKYNNLIQGASTEELQELINTLGKISKLIDEGKQQGKDLKYYQNIETILDEEKKKKVKNETELGPIVYILRPSYERDEEFQNEPFEYFYLFYPDTNKIECLVDNNFGRLDSRFGKGKLVDISQEKLQKNFISLDEFLGISKKLEIKHFMEEPKVYYTYIRYALEFCKDDKGNLSGVSLKILNENDWKEIKELEKESKEELENISSETRKYLEGMGSRKKQSKLEISPSGIYILNSIHDEKFRWKSREHFYLYHQDINKIESLRDNNNIFDRRTTPDFIEITSEELHENFISIEDFFAKSAKINYRGNSILFDGVEKGQDYYYFQQLGLRYWLDDKRNLINVKLKTFAIKETIKIEEIEKDSPKEIQKLIDKIVAFVKKRSLRKQVSKADEGGRSNDSFWENIDLEKYYRKLYGEPQFNYGDNNTINVSHRGRGRGRNNDLNYD